MLTNVHGSSAGAGSGEFHVYKASRRREYERLRLMNADLQLQKDHDLFEADRHERRRIDDLRTCNNRLKRQKARARKANLHNPQPPADASAAEPVPPRPPSTAAASHNQPTPTPTTAPAPLAPAAAAPADGLIIQDD